MMLCCPTGIQDAVYWNRERYGGETGLLESAKYTELIDNIHTYYCRRCGIYNCLSHGISHVYPSYLDPRLRAQTFRRLPTSSPVPGLALPLDTRVSHNSNKKQQLAPAHLSDKSSGDIRVSSMSTGNGNHGIGSQRIASSSDSQWFSSPEYYSFCHPVALTTSDGTGETNTSAAALSVPDKITSGLTDRVAPLHVRSLPFELYSSWFQPSCHPDSSDVLAGNRQSSKHYPESKQDSQQTINNSFSILEDTLLKKLIDIYGDTDWYVIDTVFVWRYALFDGYCPYPKCCMCHVFFDISVA